MEEVYSAIQAKNYNLAAAFERGDAAGVAAVYGEDAVLMPPNMEMFRGRAAIQSFWQRRALPRRPTTPRVRRLGRLDLRGLKRDRHE